MRTRVKLPVQFLRLLRLQDKMHFFFNDRRSGAFALPPCLLPYHLEQTKAAVRSFYCFFVLRRRKIMVVGGIWTRAIAAHSETISSLTPTWKKRGDLSSSPRQTDVLWHVWYPYEGHPYSSQSVKVVLLSCALTWVPRKRSDRLQQQHDE